MTKSADGLISKSLLVAGMMALIGYLSLVPRSVICASLSAKTSTEVYTVKPGDSLGLITHTYLGRTVYLTHGELEAALHQENPSLASNRLHPGQKIVIPGISLSPVVAHIVPISKQTPVRGIYLTCWMAGSDNGLELIRRWHEMGGNAVVFDVKDFDGIVSIPFQNPLAAHTKSTVIPSLPKFVQYVHSMGLHAIARIAVFRDASLAQRHPELMVRSRRTGKPWLEKGKQVWMDPSRKEVQDYNLALAMTAIDGGADEIQFDYVRFPAEDDQADAQFVFQTQHPGWQRSDVITQFLQRAYTEIHARGVLFSLDVFGVMAWQRPVDLSHTGQDIAAMAKYCDILSPMIYPSHFFGMDGFANPGDAPEHFISESMKRFQLITKDSNVTIRPWLQAFGWRTKSFSPEYIQVQVDTAHRNGGIGYLFWNARNDYATLFKGVALMQKPGAAKATSQEHPATKSDGI